MKIKIYKDRNTEPLQITYKGFSQCEAGAYYAPYHPLTILHEYRDIEGAFHNINGPAILYENDKVEWCIHGTQHSFNDWATMLNKSDKERAILLLKYG